MGVSVGLRVDRVWNGGSDPQAGVEIYYWEYPRILAHFEQPKLTPRSDPPEVGTRQLTLCPFNTNSLEPSPILVPPEVPASGHHGFVKWGHDAKITKIGIVPTRGSPGQGKANGSQGRRQDLGLISECTTWI